MCVNNVRITILHNLHNSIWCLRTSLNVIAVLISLWHLDKTAQDKIARYKAAQPQNGPMMHEHGMQYR